MHLLIGYYLDHYQCIFPPCSAKIPPNMEKGANVPAK